MKKKCFIIVLILASILAALVYVFLLRKHNYNINEPPKKYILKTETQQKEYIDFIKSYIKPAKLGGFLNVERIHFSFINEYDTGTASLEWFTYEAYKELFYQMFDKNRTSYNDCPVTNSFVEKFDKNLFEYFNFINVEDCDIGCLLFDDEKRIEITEAGNYNLGEPGYILYHHFHYTLDDEGNVDDVIFDYTE